MLRYTGGIAGAPGFVEADVRWSYRLTDGLELSLVGQNLLDAQHPEQGPTTLSTMTELPRSFHGKVTWRF
jgi:iron complex outermembrane receptor protein